MRQLVYTIFTSNNRASFHLWWNENLLKHQRVSKYYENNCNSTQFSPSPPSSIQLILTSIQLHSPLPSLFQHPPSSLQYLHQYSNQNIARNWAISPKLDRKIQSCSFWLKIGIHGISEVLIPSLNSDPKIHFWANLGPKSQS